MDLIISYTSADRESIRPLIEGLHRLGHSVWFDQELSGGQAWWDTILERIRACDALLVTLSPAMLDSEACAREANYARALGRPILPVMIRRVLPELLPPWLAALQIVDFTQPGDRAAFELIGALSKLSPAKPLPDPLPPPPAVPVSYLSDLSERVVAPKLDLDEQLSLVGKLKPGLGRPREREAVLEIIRRFRSRDDLYLTPAQELDAMLAAAGGAKPEPDAAAKGGVSAEGDSVLVESWTRWAEGEFAGKQKLVAVAVETALNRLKAGASSADAADAARSAARQAEKTYRDQWWSWALKEFGDARLAEVGTDAVISRVLAGASSEAGVAAARSAVQAEREARERQAREQQAPEQEARERQLVERPRYGQAQGPAIQPGRVDGEATAALVLGIVGLLCGGLVLNALAIWFGSRSRRRIAASGGQLDGAGRATAGFYLGIIGLVLWAVILLLWFISAASSGSRST